MNYISFKFLKNLKKKLGLGVDVSSQWFPPLSTAGCCLSPFIEASGLMPREAGQ